MNRILDRLYLGAHRDLGPHLGALGFTALLDLRDASSGPSPTFPDCDVRAWRLSTRDGDPWSKEDVEKALDFVYDGVRKGKVLVVCDAGMSRSASMVVGYLVRTGWSAAEAMARVRAARPEVAPKAAMLQAVLTAVGAEGDRT